MAIAHVQTATFENSVTGTSCAATFGATMGAGNAICVLITCAIGQTVSTVTDDKGNSYTLGDHKQDAAGQECYSYYLTNITNAPITITANFTATVAWRAIIASEYSGVAAVVPASAIDGHTFSTVTANGTANQVTSTAIVTTQAGDLIWGGTVNSSNATVPTAGSGFTARGAVATSGLPLNTEDILGQSSAGSIAATFTAASGSFTTFVLALKAAAVSAAVSPIISKPRLTLNHPIPLGPFDLFPSYVAPSYPAVGAPSTDPVPDEAGYWPFDGSTAPGGGSLVGTPSYATAKINQGLSVPNSAGNYVSIGSSPLTAVQIQADWTICGWVNPTDIGTTHGGSSVQRLIQFGSDASNLLWAGFTSANLLAVGGLISASATWNLDATTGALANSAWYHVCFIRRAGVVELYVNNVKQTNSGAQSHTNFTQTNLIGAATATDCWFAGLIDDVRVYARAISATELSSIYTWTGAGAGFNITPPSVALVTSPTAPSVVVSNNIAITPPAGALNETTTAPTVTVSAINFVQSAISADGTSTTGATVAASFSSVVSVNGLVCGMVFWYDPAQTITISGITDDKGNSYNVIDFNFIANEHVSAASFYKEGISNAPTTITATLSTAAGQYKRICISEYSGVATSSALDGHNATLITVTGVSGANAHVSGSITPTQNGDLIWGALTNTDGNSLGAYTAGTSPIAFTQRVNTPGTDIVIMTTEDYVQSSAASIQATFGSTGTQRDITWIAAFKVAAPGVTITVPAGALNVTQFAPSVAVSANVAIAPASGALIGAGFAPAVVATANVVITPSSVALATAPTAPSIAVTANIALSPPSLALSDTQYAPSVAVTANVAVTPVSTPLGLAALAPAVSMGFNLTAPKADLVATPTAPGAAVTANIAISPAASTLAAAGKVAALDLGITPAKASAALNATAPVVAAGANIVITPASVPLVTSLTAPSVAVTANVAISSGKGTATLMTTAPSVVATASWTVSPAKASATLSATAPSVAAGAAINITVPKASLAASTAAPGRGIAPFPWAPGAKPLAQPSGTTLVHTTDNIAAIMAASSAGDKFYFEAGVYRGVSIQAKNNQEFYAAQGAIFNGSSVLSGWTASGSDFYVTGQTQAGNINTGASCLAGVQRCGYPETVYFDNVPLKPVDAQANLAPGYFYFDYAADRIYIRDNPSGHVVEAGNTSWAFYGTTSGVRVQNFIITKYATPWQDGAIGGTEGSAGKFWTIRDNEVSWCGGNGIAAYAGAEVVSNRVHDNGVLGISGTKGSTGDSTPAWIADNEVYNNGWHQADPIWEGGGIKTAIFDRTIYYHNYVHNNFGYGVWFDIDCRWCVIDNNLVVDHEYPAISYEISYFGSVRDNVVYNAGRGDPRGDFWMQSVIVQNSASTEVMRNKIDFTDANGLTLMQQDRGSGAFGTYLTLNNYFHDNTLVSTNTGFGAIGSNGDYLMSSMNDDFNSWASNSYFATDFGGRFLWDVSYMSFASFEAAVPEVPAGSISTSYPNTMAWIYDWLNQAGALLSRVPLSASLGLVPSTPTVVTTANVALAPASRSLVLLSNAPGVQSSASISIVPPKASAVLTATAPALAFSANWTVSPAKASATLAPAAPSLDLGIAPSKASLAIAATAPGLSFGTVLSPAKAAAVLASTAPSLDAGIVPGKAALTLAATAPALALSVNWTISPPQAAAVLSGSAPGVQSSASVSIVPPKAAAVLTATAPGAAMTANWTVTAPAASLATALTAPAVAATANLNLIPARAAATLAATAPSVSTTASISLSPASVALSTAASAPGVAVTANWAVSPAKASATLATTVPAVSAGQVVAPSRGVAGLGSSSPSIAVTANWFASPPTIAARLTASAPSAGLSNNLQFVPGRVQLALSSTAPVKDIGVRAQPPKASLLLTPSVPDVAREFVGHIDQIADIIGQAAPPLEVMAQDVRNPALTGKQGKRAAVIASQASKAALTAQRSKDLKL